ncbi:DUF1156 domain-containing protein [Methylomonas sp. UP202]|nr:DUF1156 domain-containing protein [Methylomonas sp. UP202]WGS84574.1 DUF1156 domain-containing protein [Methylomonas sp. UP202]
MAHFPPEFTGLHSQFSTGINICFQVKTSEVESPLDKINEAAAREKSIRHGHLSPPSPAAKSNAIDLNKKIDDLK